MLAGALTVILCFVRWYRATTAAPWLGVVKEYLFGTLVCIYILATVGTSGGLDQWIYPAGQSLGELLPRGRFRAGSPRPGGRDVAHSVTPDDGKAFEVRFLTEARVAAWLTHPNIVIVHEVGCDETTGTLFVALEYLEGRTLAEPTAQGSRLDWREALRITSRLATPSMRRTARA